MVRSTPGKVAWEGLPPWCSGLRLWPSGQTATSSKLAIQLHFGGQYVEQERGWTCLELEGGSWQTPGGQLFYQGDGQSSTQLKQRRESRFH